MQVPCNSDDFIPTKESRRFPEIPALPPPVSMLDQLDHQLKSYPFCLFICFQIDTINPVPGVTVREGGRIMCAAKRHQSLQPPTSPRSGMCLVRSLEPHKHCATKQQLNNKQQITQVT